MATCNDVILATVRRSLSAVVVKGERVCVALSGGMDSVVLLHALVRLRAELGFELSAIHVHHGLSPNADHWSEFCMYLCRVLDVPCHVERVTLTNASGKGIEQVAREARYAAFKAMPVDVLCLAHHQNDRAETLLLNLFRGASVRGLAGAPEQRMLGRQCLLRPLISLPRLDLLAWANAHHLEWIEDESNTDLRFRRNDLRHRILPAIMQSFPGVVQVLARTAAQMQEQSGLLDRLAYIEASACRDTSGRLSVERLQHLPEPSVRNILRWALASAGWQIPAASRLEALSSQLMSASSGSEVFVRMGSIGIHIWRDQVWVDRALQQPIPVAGPVQTGQRSWPDGCVVMQVDSPQPGLILAAVGQGQRFQPYGRCRDTVTELLRARGVPPWVRPRLPALWINGALVWVAGLGWGAGYSQEGKGVEVVIDWSPNAEICL